MESCWQTDIWQVAGGRVIGYPTWGPQQFFFVYRDEHRWSISLQVTGAFPSSLYAHIFTSSQAIPLSDPSHQEWHGSACVERAITSLLSLSSYNSMPPTDRLLPPIPHFGFSLHHTSLGNSSRQGSGVVVGSRVFSHTVQTVSAVQLASYIISKQKWRMVSSGMLRRVALERTDISEELSASFIRVTRIGELGRR
jgi:hypothetical protein